MSIGGFGARPTQFGGPPEGADASPTDAATTEATTATTTAQQANAGAATAQTASSETAPASTANGQALDVWQALQKDPQAQLLQEDLLLETDAGALEDGVPVRSDDAVLDDLDEVWDNQDALYDELDQLSEGSGTGSVEGLTPTEIEARMAEIQEELDFLYAYEDLLVDELADPDLGFFDSFWTEWDLWDVKFDIADLESEMADLQGASLDWSFDDLWSQYAQGFGESVDGVLDFMDWKSQETVSQLDASATRGTQDVDDRERLERERQAARIRKREDASRAGRATTVTRRSSTRPEISNALPGRLRGIKQLAIDLAGAPSETARARLKVAARLIRGEQPEIAREIAET